MATKPSNDQIIADLLRDMISIGCDSLIAKLSMAGVSQHQIRKVLGVDMHRVNRIAKLLKKAGKGEI